MRKIVVNVIALALLSICSGCIDASTVIMLKKDGSGMITETVYMGAAMEQMMGQMMGGMDGATATASTSTAKPKLEEEKYRKKAVSMGEGVKYVKAKHVTKPDGSTGVKVYYSFADITKLKVKSDPEPQGDNPMGGGESAKDEDFVTFDFTKGDKSKLVVNLPQDDAADNTGAEEMPTGEMGAPDAQQTQMMKMMLKGLRIRMSLKVEGEIVESNASYVSKSSKTGKKQYVTLFDMNFDKLLNDAESFGKLTSMGQPESMTSAMSEFSKMPGMKVETKKKVEITFK